MNTCPKCNASLSDNEKLFWKCPDCGKTFALPFNVLLNAKTFTKADSIPLIKCSSCGKAFHEDMELMWKCNSCKNILHGNINYLRENYFKNHQIKNVIDTKKHPNLMNCPDCGSLISTRAFLCPHCGCPLNEKMLYDYMSNTPKKRSYNIKKIVIPIMSILVLFTIVISLYSFFIIKPQNTYNKANSLLETGKYEEANFLFDKIKNYKDVPEIKEQLKYESYAYSSINDLKRRLKNPDSYNLYEITFYKPMDTKNDKIETSQGEKTERYPVCIMHYGAQNGFGGNTVGYAISSYDEELQKYITIGSCDSLDEADYDKDDEDDAIEIIICSIINLYITDGENIGEVNFDRLKTVLKNDAYSTIKIIE